MNRQSGSLAPIPVTPKATGPSPSIMKRKSREGRRSWLSFPARPRNSPIWRPSTGHSPPTPQWPLPRHPISQQPGPQQSQRPVNTADNEPNPSLNTRPRDAPPPPLLRTTSSSSTTPTLKDNPGLSPRTREAPSDTTRPLHPLSPRCPPPTSPPRPSYAPHQRNGSFHTRYMNMAMSTRQIPRHHNILSNVFAWMVLLAFAIAPANFCGELAAAGNNPAEPHTHVPSVALLAASCTIFGVGAAGMLWLALCWRRNYIWLMNRIYLPLMLNSLAGVIASVVIIDIQDHMWFDVAAYVSLAIEGTTLVMTGGLFFYTHYLLLGKLKREHARETSTKNVVELVKAGKRPPFAPGSVV